jgi:hypothetical protein
MHVRTKHKTMIHVMKFVGARAPASGTHVHMHTMAKPQDTDTNTDTSADADTDAQAEITEKYGLTYLARKCAYVELTNADIAKRLKGVECAGVQADAPMLISIGSYITRMKTPDAQRTFAQIAADFDFDAHICAELKAIRIEAHEGVTPERTDDAHPSGALESEAISALRKTRKDASKKSKAKDKAAAHTSKHAHGGLGQHIANFFTFGMARR